MISPLKRPFERRREEPDEPVPATISPEIQKLAASEIDLHVRQNDALFERIDRWDERVERLQSDGASSESAANRANRAREEALDGLNGVRRSFVATNGEEGARAFDAELRSRYPGLVEDR